MVVVTMLARRAFLGRLFGAAAFALVTSLRPPEVLQAITPVPTVSSIYDDLLKSTLKAYGPVLESAIFHQNAFFKAMKKESIYTGGYR